MEFIVGTLLCLATFTQWFCDSSIFLPLLVLIDIFSQLSNVILYESTIFHFLLLLFFLVLYWFCHISTWIRHGCTRVPHPEPPPTSLPIPSVWVMPVHQPGAPCIMHRTWTGISFHIWYYTCFNAILPNHPTHSRPLPQSPKDCSIHLCLFCCLAYRVIITIFLNSIYMR